MMQMGQRDEIPCQEQCGEVFSLAARREALRRAERLHSPKPYCGRCLDESGEINDLMPHLLRLEGGVKATGYWCPGCGAEF